MLNLISFFGLFCMIFLAWLLSTHKNKFPWRVVISGILLQLLFGFFILRTSWGQAVFDGARGFFQKVIGFSDAGAQMVFGDLFTKNSFALNVLPPIIFVSALLGILFHFGIMQKIVKAMAWVMVRLMNTSGSESLTASAEVFLGQTEAPLVIRPYIPTMTQSELLAMMIAGMATVSGGTLAAYIGFGMDAGYLLAASIMGAPAALLIAKCMIPETETSMTKGVVRLDLPKQDANFLDAACRGAGEGLRLAVNVAAMLIAFVALAALVNYELSLFPEVAGAPLSFERILGWIFWPVAAVMGVPFHEISSLSQLLGQKLFLNEFVAYMELAKIQAELSPRTTMIATFALCGFANFASVAIQIGGIGALVPERRKDLARFGIRAMIGGMLATNMTACVAGIFSSL
jgi:CNT family concentrative nucleoside transporter